MGISCPYLFIIPSSSWGSLAALPASKETVTPSRAILFGWVHSGGGLKMTYISFNDRKIF